MSADAIGLTAVHGRSVDAAVTATGLRAGGMSEAEAEFTAFFRLEFSRVVRTVSLIVGDRGLAEEVAQEAFVQLFDHWRKVSRYERPDAWVRRVAIRIATRAARRERMRRMLENRFLPVATAPDAVEPDSDVYAAVRRLPMSQRAAVVLFYFEDRPVSDLAPLMGCSPATARVHLHKARRRLAALLSEGVDDVV